MAEVTIYTREFCGYCARALKLLRDKGVAFTQIDAGMDVEKRKEMIQRSGRSTYPQVFVGDKHLGGSDDIAALDREGKLDALLAG